MTAGAPGAAPAPGVEEVRTLLDEWVQATLARDAAQYADLFMRDNDAVVAWASGEVSHGWHAVYDHALRELYHAKVHIQDVDIEQPRVTLLGEHVMTTVFTYTIHFRDLWGTLNAARRLSTMTLVRTKDGLRIASAHFSKIA